MLRFEHGGLRGAKELYFDAPLGFLPTQDVMILDILRKGIIFLLLNLTKSAVK